MHYRRSLCNTVVGIVLSGIALAAHAGPAETRYQYSAAVQEITQLYWLAETAHTCGWATREEADEFEAFAVRFLSAHLSRVYRAAFYSMINQASFQPAVQRVAYENRSHNCGLARWRNGWISYKSAADENASRY
ncbi:MAG: hypothetical protein JSU95_14580 [Betaproteobacteria bacterium]|nr:MAG: hypothetical protein JSU95_14580 [Betaproteobacteria bacterium]